MSDIKLQNNRGFTLIELLVVISIIGLLSVIILTSLNDSRDRAQNSKKNQLVYQYVNALELYASEYNSYPAFDGMVQNTWYCIGDSLNETCQENRSYSDELNNLIVEFIPGPPEDTFSVIISDPYLGNIDYKGIAYRCTVLDTVSDTCAVYDLQWFLRGGAQNCIPNANAFPFQDNFYCRY
jgi:prepilin-type N-terminal cleavage/methylation domain-containing protein